MKKFLLSTMLLLTVFTTSAFANDYGSMGDAFSSIFLVFGIFMFALAILMIISWWKIFEKAGEPGWQAIIPIYNAFIILKIAGKPAWWFLLYLIPFVNIIIGFMVILELAIKFNKDFPYALGIIFLPFIFLPMLAFGKAEYKA